MGVLSKAVAGVSSKSVNQVVKGPGYELSRGFMPNWTLDHYYANDYENAFPSIRVISQRFAAIEPYTINAKGDGTASNVLDRLYTPNTAMSAYDFREALAIMSLVHNKVYIRVHHKGDRITADSITGFTFLEAVSEQVMNGRLEFWLPNGEKLTPAEVVVLKGINPYNLNEGFSHAYAARRWTSLDDLIADFQTGFFNNGAVPAGQFIITAKNATEFKDMVAAIKENHQGAGRNNGVMYAHRPIDPVTQKPGDAQVEWVPFSTQNKDMALKELFDQANKKIDSTYGVPASLRGVNDANTYASVRVDEQLFVENTLEPFTLKIWQRFTHQLNQITGGMGVAITYDLETPVVADEEKVKAEAKQTDAQTLINLTGAGYSLDSAIQYVKTGDISVLKKLQEPKKKPEVLDSNEAKDTPDQPVDPTMPSKSASKQLSARDIPDLYDGTGINPDNLGCIMVDTEQLTITSLVDGGEADLVQATDRHEHQMGAVAEQEPHITLLYGLLENGHVWKDKVDAVLKGWTMEKATIDKVDFFDTPDSYAVIAHIEPTPELIDGHERLTLLPHIQTFSEYKPHMTLAYIDKSADVNKWVKALGDAYNGREIKVTGINYGDNPDSSKSATPPKAKALSPSDRADYEEQLREIVRRRMSAQIDAAMPLVTSKDVSLDQPVDSNEDALLTDGMLAVLLGLIAYQGPIEQEINANLLFEAGIDLSQMTSFHMNALQESQYKAYMQRVARGYNQQTADRIRNIILTGRQESLSAGDIKRQLKSLMNEDWRITRIVNSEVNHAGNSASLWSMQNIAKETGAKVEKLWDHVGGDEPCPMCLYMLSLDPVDVFDNYVMLGETIQLPDGNFYTNDFMPVDGSRDVHPHGHCRQIYRVVR